MTLWEKVGFFFLPIFLPLFMPIAAFFLHLCVSTPSPRLVESGRVLVVFIAFSCVVFGAILVYPVWFFCKMRARKRKTGSLSARRRTGCVPASEKASSGVDENLGRFALFAACIRHHLSHDGDVSPPGAGRVERCWLFWLIAIAVTIDMARPRSERRWTGIVFRGLRRSGGQWLRSRLSATAVTRLLIFSFPLLFASLSGFLAVMTVYDGRKKSADAPREGL